MLCERCGKHEANVHIRKNVNGKVTEMHLCGKCARESVDIVSTNSVFRDFFTSAMPARARRFNPFDRYALNEYAGCEDCLEDMVPKAETHQKKEKNDKEALIDDLRTQIKTAVENEEYEKAAELRDRIRGLEKENS